MKKFILVSFAILFLIAIVTCLIFAYFVKSKTRLPLVYEEMIANFRQNKYSSMDQLPIQPNIVLPANEWRRQHKGTDRLLYFKFGHRMELIVDIGPDFQFVEYLVRSTDSTTRSSYFAKLPGIHSLGFYIWTLAFVVTGAACMFLYAKRSQK